MSTHRGDTRLLVIAGICVALAGVLLAAFIYVASSQGGSPTKYAPFDAGLERNIEQTLSQGGPYFTPDPFGGNKTILWALENGNVVALNDALPTDASCTIRWRGSIDSFVDCHGRKLRSEQLERFKTSLSTDPATRGALFVDLRALEPPPQPLP